MKRAGVAHADRHLRQPRADAAGLEQQREVGRAGLLGQHGGRARRAGADDDHRAVLQQRGSRADHQFQRFVGSHRDGGLFIEPQRSPRTRRLNGLLSWPQWAAAPSPGGPRQQTSREIGAQRQRRLVARPAAGCSRCFLGDTGRANGYLMRRLVVAATRAVFTLAFGGALGRGVRPFRIAHPAVVHVAPHFRLAGHPAVDRL